MVINIFSPKFIEMSRYKGRCFRFVDSKKWTYLIFNHYDSYATSREILTEINNHFDLSYSFPEANGALAATFKNGNVLKEFTDKYKPSELIKLFPSDDEPRVDPGLLRMILFSNVEPRKMKDTGWVGGGRYMIDNLNMNNAGTEMNHGDDWNIGGTKYLEISEANGFDGSLDTNERAPGIGASNSNDLMPKSYFYIFSHYQDWSESQFNKPEHRIHKVLKNYMLNPPIDPIKPEAELETATQTEVDALKTKDIALSERIDSLEKSIENNRIFIDELKAQDIVLQKNIDTSDESRKVLVNNVEVLKRENLETTKSVLQSHGVIKEIVNTQRHNYNYEWTAWNAPIRLQTNSDGSVKLANNRESNFKRESKVENELKELKMRFNNLSDINNEMFDIVKMCLKKLEKLEK